MDEWPLSLPWCFLGSTVDRFFTPLHSSVDVACSESIEIRYIQVAIYHLSESREMSDALRYEPQLRVGEVCPDFRACKGIDVWFS